MIKFITLKILKIFDLYYQLKIFKFLKKKNFNEFEFFFDVGAHTGESISLFRKNFKISNIYSFEASPINFKILEKNVKKIKRKYKNTKFFIENYALGNENNKIIMKQVNESSSSTINKINTNSKYFKKKSLFFKWNKENFFSEIEINQITLNDYIKRHAIPKIDFIKIDTEGWELNVIKGLEDQLHKTSLIMFEHTYNNMIVKDYKFRDIHKFLKQNNFSQIYKYKMAFRKTFEYIYKRDKSLEN